MTYHARRRMKTILTVLGYILLAAALVWGLWLVWAERYVVYTADGVRLDFSRDYHIEGGEPAESPENATVAIHYNEGDVVVKNSTALTQITGYYVTTSMLIDSVENVESTIRSLPKGTAIMLDLKSIYGNFYYSTDVVGAAKTDQIDISAVDQMIKTLAKSDYYLIARLPAFRDRSYGLKYPAYGLPTEQGYLWFGSDNCYWLNPSSSGTMFYLTSIVTELRTLGFDEVVLTDFCFPDTNDIVWNSDLTRQEAIYKAAEDLVDDCATATFAVSFATSDLSFTLPEGRTRLYLTGVEAADALDVLSSSAVPNSESQLVFLTEANDTRYDIASVLRPLPVME